MNENVIDDISSGNTNDINTDSSTNITILGGQSGMELQSDYYYDYRSYLQTIINNQNTQISTLQDTQKLINEGFTFISFILCIAGTYMLVKNFIRK